MRIAAGQMAPDFAATTLAGEPIALNALRGKVVIVDFWATWCMPCIAEMPNLRKVHEAYAATGEVVVVGISMDTERPKVEHFARTHAPWAHILGGPAEGNAIAKQYAVSGVPALYIIDYEGKVAARDVRGRRLLPTVMAEVGRARRAATADPPSTEGRVVQQGTPPATGE